MPGAPEQMPPTTPPAGPIWVCCEAVRARLAALLVLAAVGCGDGDQPAPQAPADERADDPVDAPAGVPAADASSPALPPEAGDATDAGVDTRDAAADAGDTGPQPQDTGEDAPTIDAAPPDGDRADARRLSAEGLYTDFANKIIAADVRPFAPAHELWSDGATKRRWVVLPPGAKIDTSDMDHWRFPVGTRFWKEFSRDGVLLETRLIEKTGPGDRDYWFGAFVWAADQSEATFRVEGARNVNGTGHDVPTQSDCWTCHQGDLGRALGFSAVQLSHEGPGVTLASLTEEGKLSHPPLPGSSFAPPGPPEVGRALGYLHANCAHCHNPFGYTYFQTLNLRLDVNQRTPETTNAYRTTVNAPTRAFDEADYPIRVVPGHPETSAIVFRMNQRGDKKQMPPLATELVHPAGIEIVSTWIRALSP